MRKLTDGELLSRNDLKEIACNYTISKHAAKRIAERKNGIFVAGAILNSKFAYMNTDGTYNVSINEYEYFVISHDFHIITFKEKSHNSINIYQKRDLALRGISRRPMVAYN